MARGRHHRLFTGSPTQVCAANGESSAHGLLDVHTHKLLQRRSCSWELLCTASLAALLLSSIAVLCTLLTLITALSSWFFLLPGAFWLALDGAVMLYVATAARLSAATASLVSSIVAAAVLHLVGQGVTGARWLFTVEPDGRVVPESATLYWTLSVVSALCHFAAFCRLMLSIVAAWHMLVLLRLRRYMSKATGDVAAVPTDDPDAADNNLAQGTNGKDDHAEEQAAAAASSLAAASAEWAARNLHMAAAAWLCAALAAAAVAIGSHVSVFLLRKDSNKGCTGCNPLDLTLCALPWPSSAYLVPDNTTATSVRVAIPPRAMPMMQRGRRLSAGASCVSTHVEACP